MVMVLVSVAEESDMSEVERLPEQSDGLVGGVVAVVEDASEGGAEDVTVH